MAVTIAEIATRSIIALTECHILNNVPQEHATTLDMHIAIIARTFPNAIILEVFIVKVVVLGNSKWENNKTFFAFYEER